MPWLSFAVTGLCISVSLFHWLIRGFIHPIEALVQALKKVAAGDFEVRLPEDAGNEELKEVNKNFNKMVKELNSMELLQSDFIQNVSHEIKTPLSAMKGYAILLRSAELSEPYCGYVEQILEGTGRLSDLTGNILRLSKLEHQQIVSEKHVFALDEQLRQAVLFLEPVWNKKEVLMELHLPELWFYGNEELLFQVWTNLLSNAVKFTPAGGQVTVTLAEKGENVCVEVRDTGVGMTEEVKKHIFEKFYQGDRNRSMEGNGLGLALVRKITELCGGSVTVESELNQGSVFTVILPRAGE